jgi:hypothetical protein
VPGGTDHCVHEDEEVACPVLSFLVLKEKIHESLFESDHWASPAFIAFSFQCRF